MQDFENDQNNYIRIEGTVEHIIYQNKDNYYTVCELDGDLDEPTILVGYMPFLTMGETIMVMGNWIVHAKYGRQFKVEYFEKQLPNTSSAILKYLSSGAVKGIGKATAKRIVGQFGVDSFDVIENHPEWLSDVPGISPKKAKAISENYKEQYGIRTVMLYCSQYFGPTISLRIYNEWGTAAIDIIKNDPYRLPDEILGVSFQKADTIAKGFSIENDFPSRIRGGIKYVLSHNAISNGHCYIPYSKLVGAASVLLEVDESLVEKEIDNLVTSGDIVISRLNSKKSVYLFKYYDAERFCANKLVSLQKYATSISNSDVERIIQIAELEQNLKYGKMQIKAINYALNNNVSIITGGPGTGKTTIVRGILGILNHSGNRVALAAPTGRAAKRMSEATNYEAKTLHRLLEVEFSSTREPQFARNANNLLEYDTVIVDESSMIDILLFDALLKAMKPGSRLILIGDVDQLPSVGAGNVLKDLIESDIFPTVKLKEIFRQAKESLIVTNAHSINNGEYPNLENKINDFFFIPYNEESTLPQNIANLCLNRLPKAYNRSIIDGGIQVITPSHGGAAGTDILNEVLHNACNPVSKDKKKVTINTKEYRVGDKIMQTRNNYDVIWVKNDVEGYGIFNGDTGVITDIDLEMEQIEINFDGRIAVYEYPMMDDIDFAYAITIHKSQGSEYPIVVIPSFEFSFKLLTRNLLYTAVTRAQELVVIVGKKDIIYKMVDNNKISGRYTALDDMVKEIEAMK